MSDPFLNKLNELENNIFDFSEIFHTFLRRIRDIIQGSGSDSHVEDLLFELLKNLSNVKDHMHKYIDETYTDNNFENKNKSFQDMNEQMIYIKELALNFNKLK
jgi:hypothetical protein